MRPSRLTLRPHRFLRRELTAGTSRHYVTTHAVQTGRGCRHCCKFFSITAFARGTHRSRPLEHVLEELKSIPRNFMFVDDNIIADPEYAKRLFRAMTPLGKRWISQCSLKIADDPELLDLARAAGCCGLFVGIETISQENLDAVDKGFNDRHGYSRRIAAIQAKGIGVQAGIIVGLDGDDPTVFQRTLQFLEKAHVNALQLAILTPQPGTPLYDEFERAGRITDRDWRHYDYRHVVMRPARISAQQLQDGADWLYRQFYRLDRIVLRTIRAHIYRWADAGLPELSAEHDLSLRQPPREDRRQEPGDGRQGVSQAYSPSRRVCRPWSRGIELRSAKSRYVICQTAIRSTSPKPFLAVSTAAGGLC